MAQNRKAASMRLAVRRSPIGRNHLALIEGPGFRYPCAIGRSGLRVRKREGDGATPIGRLVADFIIVRGDRVGQLRTRLPVQTMRRNDGWCDAPDDRNYNRHVEHPYPASAERLWREDGLYDVIVVLSYNRRPRRRHFGSAIFMHCAGAGFAATEGCVALRRSDLIALARRMTRRTAIVIGGG